MAHAHLPTTEAAVAAVREIAEEFGREVVVTHDVGADRTSRRTGVGSFAVTDPDGTLPHEAYLEMGGAPAVTVQLFAEGDAAIVVDGVEFRDVPRDSVPAFLRSVLGGLAFVRSRFFPPGQRLLVPLPGDRTYSEPVPGFSLTPWLARSVRS
ncbi:hypothetical protein ACFV3R_33860 [Streptomyces sp. NPDC059740]|uniref:hypothetical protein n=1 Tax=Streptomyces sp. NPDC059740 TaxID=3346926 RepID=UPI003658442E